MKGSDGVADFVSIYADGAERISVFDDKESWKRLLKSVFEPAHMGRPFDGFRGNGHLAGRFVIPPLEQHFCVGNRHFANVHVTGPVFQETCVTNSPGSIPVKACFGNEFTRSDLRSCASMDSTHPVVA